MSVYESRLRKLRKALSQARVDGLLVTDFLNVTYLTGFTGDDSYLLVNQDNAVLVTDFRYVEQLEKECPDLTLIVRKSGERLVPVVCDLIAAERIERLGIEASSMTVALRNNLAESLEGVDLIPLEETVETLRLIKDKTEIAATKQAVYVAQRAFGVARASLRPEQTEFEVATELEYQARKFGGSGLSFPAIVAAGPNAALPHAQPGDRRIGDHDFTLCDWGAKANLYVSDLTRMIVTGKVTAKFRNMYNLVLEANMAAIDAIKPGISCEEVDSVARDIIAKAGHGKRFGHSLGHGTGMLVHEGPRLSIGQQNSKLEAGMIVTIEPGVYFPGWGGIRIEDDVLVTRSGHEVLTSVPKQLDDCLLS